jgi:hypothetical protein
MITSDEKKWAESNNEKLYEIAKDIWSKKYTTEQLRGFQLQYDEIRLELPFFADTNRFMCYQNMWQCATFAISIREFGE